MIGRHPSETILIAHSTGNLPALHSRVLAVHLDQCPACRTLVQSMEEIGGALLSSMPRAALGEDALARTLARLPDPGVDTYEEPAPDTLASLTTGKWLWAAPGMWLMPVAERDMTGTRMDLVRVAPGTTLPVHDHADLETTCVLQGGFSDVSGSYGLYDIEVCGPGQMHAPAAAPGGDCICLMAVTKRLRPQGLVAKLVHRYFDI